MKKKSWLLVIVMMIAALCMGLFAACGEKEEDGPDYVGLFSYTKAEGGYVTSAYLNLKEDGTFYYKSEFLAKPDLGTYEYNADKTKITLNMTVDPNLSGTFDVEINDAGLVVIKNVGFFYYEGELLFDNFTYDSVSPKPVEQPIEIVTFFVEGDKGSTLTFYTGNRYELLVTRTGSDDIVSNGTYTRTDSGNNVTFALTDTLGTTSATYTYTCTYTAADGYGNGSLTGTGITDAISFVTKVTPTSTLTGSDTNYSTTVTLDLFGQTAGTFELTYSVFGSPDTVVTGSFAIDFTTMGITFTGLDGAGASVITSVTGALDATTFAPSVTVNFNIPTGTDAGNMTFSVTLAPQAAA